MSLERRGLIYSPEAHLRSKSQKKSTLAAEMLGSVTDVSDSTLHKLSNDGVSSNLVNFHYLHSVGGPWARDSQPRTLYTFMNFGSRPPCSLLA